MIGLSVEERRARLVVRHRLASVCKARDAVDATRSMVALHSTDAATVYLSAWARTENFTPGDLDDALYEERALVRILGMRRTLFVVPRELVPVVYAACTRTIAARERKRLEQFIVESGITTRPGPWLARASNSALETLDDLGEASTTELVAAVPLLAQRLRLGVGTRFEASQSAGSRILRQLAAEGLVVRTRPRGSWTNGQYRWRLMEAWLRGPIEELDVAPAQAELLGRWLLAFGPATETDLRWWTGWTARETRAALAAVPHVDVDLDGASGFLHADDVDSVEPPPSETAFLPTLDPTTMGWKERDWYLGAHGPTLFDRNGNAGPTVWWEGRVVGGWAQRADGEIAYRLLERVGSDAGAAIEREAERLQEWLGDVRCRPGFLPPFQRALGK